LACDVKVEELPIAEASKLWAKMFFEEKYWDIVRVVQVMNKELPQEMKNDDNVEYFKSFWERLSMEFCGWTHVSNTKEIWSFVIINQEAVASGIKRITAYTGPKVIERLQEIKGTLRQVEEKLWVKAENQILDKLEKELKEKEEMNSKFESINTKMIIDSLKSWDYKSNETFDRIINVSDNSILKDLSFKDITFQCKTVFEWLDIVVFNNDWWYAIITNKKNAQEIAKNLWVRWWWNANIVQWKDPKILENL
jgi:alanyl-tRNA synthetase